MAILIRSDIKMSKGKVLVQVSYVVVKAYYKSLYSYNIIL